jgi:uncharacterized coiled-coil DUF342 family protein
MRQYSEKAKQLRTEYEQILNEIEKLEDERDVLEQKMRDETGGCDCFAARIGCNGHAGRRDGSAGRVA